MAKDVDLRHRVTHQEAVPPKKPPRPDASGLRTPPPATAPAGTIDKPIPAGTVIKGKGPSLTPMEVEALRKAGWKEGQPIPPDIAELARAIHAEAQTFVPPVSLDTPPLKVNVVDIEQLDPRKQAVVRKAIAEALAADASPAQSPPVAQPRKQADAPTIASQAIPGWKPPGDPLYRPTVSSLAEDPGRPTQVVTPTPAPQGDLQIDVDLPPRAEVEPTPTPPPAPVAPAAEAEDEAPTFAPEPLMEFCPHCNWQLSLPDIPEPDYGEKIAFLQSVLGQKPFTKDYDLLGNRLRVRFRTLTTKEIDTIYKQVLLEREQGKIPSIEDYLERINRYRMYLQVCQVVSSGFHHDLPDGYDKATNPHAESVYQFDVPNDPRETALPQIEDFMVSDVFRTETVQRIVHNQCAKFNRLVAKMEALVDNSDFWQLTEEQS